MENEIKESIKISISLTLASLIILGAGIFANLSYSAYNHRVRTESINYNIQLHSRLYNYFINPNRKISGTDILDFISLYTKNYKYCIVLPDEIGNHIEVYQLDNSYLTKWNIVVGRDLDDQVPDRESSRDEMWTQAYLIDNVLGEDVYASYIGVLMDDNMLIDYMDELSKGSPVIGSAKTIEDVTEVDSRYDIWLTFIIVE